jgi:hypothetical protein
MNEPQMTQSKPEAGAPTAGSASRLWRVTVEYTLLVVADNECEAATEAEYYAGEDGSEPDMSIAHQVCSIEDVPNEWRNSLPFGGDRKDERTCRERVTPNAKMSDTRPTPPNADVPTSVSAENGENVGEGRGACSSPSDGCAPFVAAAVKIENALYQGGFGHAIWCNYQHPTCRRCNCGVADLIIALNEYRKEQ